jgi:hypothetical protein
MIGVEWGKDTEQEAWCHEGPQRCATRHRAMHAPTAGGATLRVPTVFLVCGMVASFRSGNIRSCAFEANPHHNVPSMFHLLSVTHQEELGTGSSEASCWESGKTWPFARADHFLPWGCHVCQPKARGCGHLTHSLFEDCGHP